MHHRRVMHSLTLSALALLALQAAPTWAETAAHSHEIHWGYTGEAAAEHWGDLKAEYALCKDGKSQSPIDISSAQPAKLDKIKFSYEANASEIVNNGHTIQVNMGKGSRISVDGKTYELLQFHFHSPSEHTIDGKPADMVAHLVHKSADGQLGVVGVLMNTGKANPVIAALWQHLPQHEGEKNALVGLKLDLNQLLPKDRAYYHYSGSLTTPPCSEGVNWMVLKSPVTVSAEQLSAYTALYHGNARPVQPLNERSVEASK